MFPMQSFIKHYLFLPIMAIISMMGISCSTTHEKQVEEVLSQMTTRQKVAQLIMVSCDSYNLPAKRLNRDTLVREEGIGGLIIFHDSLPRSIARLNELQSMSRIPLLVGVDGEWGPSMRYSEFPFFPRQMQLGALSSDTLVYQMGLAIAEQCKMVNLHINFAPVVDINTNPKNPVIHTRSFGENKERVTQFASAYMRGMQDGGIYASAKHFPGHGDTDVDSHRSLPILPFSRERLDSLELYPFKSMIEQDVAMVMIGHLFIPSLDTIVSTLSHKVVTKLLKEEMKFDGIVVTDALNMKGVSSTLRPSEVTLAAYKAGVDLLLMPNEVKRSIDLIVSAVESGECSMEDLDNRVRKILRLKAKLGMLTEGYSALIDSTDIVNRVRKPEHIALAQKLADHSITMVENRGNLVPLDTNKRIAYVAYNAKHIPLVRFYGELDGLSGYCPETGMIDSTTILYQQIKQSNYNIDYFKLNKKSTLKEIAGLEKSLTSYDMIILACHDPYGRPKDNLIDEQHMEALGQIVKTIPTLMVQFSTPYGLNNIPWISDLGSIIISYQDSESNQLATSKVLTGLIPALGVLPVSAAGYTAQ